uniref:Uncharacterized protein n=1 Tax=Corethron hystrix TaxID=216773 RepID=A0A7S1B566_9STRA|mmetsp:Transcript_13035/g.28766  ORF Transcript_13035/g.28766 Transcript_13035/m.28766 type:complete len:109 (+) Transcript_13035:170-496(+)
MIGHMNEKFNMFTHVPKKENVQERLMFSTAQLYNRKKLQKKNSAPQIIKFVNARQVLANHHHLLNYILKDSFFQFRNKNFNTFFPTMPQAFLLYTWREFCSHFSSNFC